MMLLFRYIVCPHVECLTLFGLLKKNWSIEVELGRPRKGWQRCSEVNAGEGQTKEISHLHFRNIRERDIKERAGIEVSKSWIA